MKNHRTLFNVILLIVIIYLFLLFIWRVEDFQDDKRPSVDRLYDDGSNYKYILLWNSLFGREDYYFGLGNAPFFEHECKINQCYITNNRDVKSIDEFDAVVFHGPEYSQKTRDFPKVRHESQIYVYLSFEAPVYRPVTKSLNGLFNWTVSYRLDSDVAIAHFDVKDMEGNQVAPSLNPKWMKPTEDPDYLSEIIHTTFRSKSKPVAWFSSNCHSKSNRETLVKDLQQYIDVDVYGSCGPLECPRSRDAECFRMLSRDYYFYLSYENSVCEDYITEKVKNPMVYDTVPVIYGGSNLTRFLPPGSYIDAASMSTYELGKKLNHLIKHPAEYAKYFWWRKFYRMSTRVYATPLAFCALCEKLHTVEKGQRKIYGNLLEWWHGTSENPVCR